MPLQHTVEQGEHLSRIAAEHGFGDIGPIWDHPENAELRQTRGNPNVLLAGDQLFIPDKVEKIHRAPTEQRSRFRVRAPKVLVRLRLLDLFGNALSDTDCELELGGQHFSLKTDGDGKIEQEVQATAEHGTLRAGDLQIEIRVGHLDPIDTPTGLQARLNNLGYYVGDVSEGVDPERLRFAIELFQRDNDLAVDGEPSQALLDKVKDQHGC